MPVMHLTPEQMDEFERAYADNPAAAKLHQLTVDEAERVGGVGLQAMRLFIGHIFGEPVMMTLDEVAARLELSEDAVSDAIEAIYKAACERWTETEEFKQWRSPENFSYINFSEPAAKVVDTAARLAFEDGSDATTCRHLRTALDTVIAADRPKREPTQSNFAPELGTLLRRAHATAVGAGEIVELRHLRDALEAETT